MGTEFKIYDNGLNPKKCVYYDKIRSEIAGALYVHIVYCFIIIEKESNMLGTKGPRRMSIFMPEVKENGERVKFKPIKKEDGIA